MSRAPVRRASPAIALSGVFLALLVASCATIRPPVATLAVRCNVPEASVVIDDIPLGPAARWAPPGQPIPPGFHRIEVRHPSYYSHYAEVQLSAGGSSAIAIDLHPLLD